MQGLLKVIPVLTGITTLLEVCIQVSILVIHEYTTDLTIKPGQKVADLLETAGVTDLQCETEASDRP